MTGFGQCCWAERAAGRLLSAWAALPARGPGGSVLARSLIPAMRSAPVVATCLFAPRQGGANRGHVQSGQGMDALRSLALSIPAIRRLHDGRDALPADRDGLLTHLQHCRADLLAAQSGLAAAKSDSAAILSHSASQLARHNNAFDVEKVVRRHAAPDVQPHAGCLTNFLGVLIDPKSFPQLLDGRDGQVEGVSPSPVIGTPTWPNSPQPSGRWTRGAKRSRWLNSAAAAG